jgi:hypothetical protein
MKVTTLRLIVQHAAFVVFTYGGSLRISLGTFIPCLSCPFVYSCTGYCYLFMFQRTMGTLLMPFYGIYRSADPWGDLWRNGSAFLVGLAIFSLLVVLLGKAWCGWLCPFGVLQDWITRLRRALGIRESELALKHKHKLSSVKYWLLGYAAALPILASAGLLPADFILAFCNICPAKAIMPLFGGDSQYLALDLSTAAAFGFSAALLTVTAATLIGMFY